MGAGVVDYHGSRLVALEPIAWPSASESFPVMSGAFARSGVPERVLTDRGSVFRSELFESMLAGRLGVKHTLTRPCHPWTNGRIERIFRTLKETIANHFWLLRSRGQVERVCRDFVLFYNAHRPHSSFGGRTPDELHAGRDACAGHFGRLALFDERLCGGDSRRRGRRRRSESGAEKRSLTTEGVDEGMGELHLEVSKNESRFAVGEAHFVGEALQPSRIVHFELTSALEA